MLLQSTSYRLFYILKGIILVSHICFRFLASLSNNDLKMLKEDKVDLESYGRKLSQRL